MDRDKLLALLGQYFDPQEVKFKPAVVSGNRAMALAYIDARVIQDRLDEVCGIDGWQDEYQLLVDGSVMCRLSIRMDSEWITKVDVGSKSEQPDEGDQMKAAFSDALKRAAVKFGIGRYLYRLPAQWVDYDPHKKQFLKRPQLPDWARPSPQTGPPATATSASGPTSADGAKSATVEAPKTAADSTYEKGMAILNGCTNLKDLALAWKAMSPEMRKACQGAKDRLKKTFEEVKDAASTS